MLEKTWRWFGPKDTISLAEIKQMGVEGIVTALHHIGNGEVWPVEEIMKVKNDVEAHGMRWSVVESLPVSEGIKTANADRQRLIDNYKRSLHNLGLCGIDTVCYNFMPVLDWVRTDINHKLANGAESMYFDYPTFVAFDIFILKRPGAKNDYNDELVAQAHRLFLSMSAHEQETLAYNIIVLTQGFINGSVAGAKDYKTLFLSFLEAYKNIDSIVLRKNLSAFLNDIMPVADQYGIKMCIHPDDPPFPVLGLPRIVSTQSDLEWVTQQYPSTNNGVTLCAGSLSVLSETNFETIVKSIGSHIHFIHLRSTQRLGNRCFYEAGHLEGSVDMYGVMKALLLEQKKRQTEGRADFRMPFRPDHGLKVLDDFKRQANPGYPLIGRLKGLAELVGMGMAIERNINDLEL